MPNFTEDIKVKVWKKASAVSKNDPDIWRKDQCGAWIRWSAYGDRDHKYGWEIDHIKPVSKGGTNELSNLRPLHWENNMSKLDDKLKCKVTSEGNKNIYKK